MKTLFIGSTLSFNGPIYYEHDYSNLIDLKININIIKTKKTKLNITYNII